MNPRHLRRVQLGLVGVLALVGMAVALTLRRPQPGAPSPPTELARGEANTTRTGELVYRLYREGRESLALKAGEMQGSEKEELQFKRVELAFPYVAQGQPARGTLTARECRYVPALQKARFRGDVVLRTSDGFELRTQALSFRADSGVARGDRPLSFRRKDMSGSGTGFVYHAERGTVELLADAFVRLADPDRPAAEIRSGRAVLERDQGAAEFLEGVRGRQGADTLEAQSYRVEFVKDTRAIHRAQAYGDVVLTLRGGGTALPGAAPPALRASGPRVLRAGKVDLWFRPDRSVEELAAGPGAELRLLPGPGDREGPRTLRARVLVFRFDPQGRLYEVQGQKESYFLSEPAAGSAAPPLEGTCRSFVARLDPATGEVQRIDFRRDVDFTRGDQRAGAQRARYLAQGLLRLMRRPEVRDASRRSRLVAETIDLHTLTGDLEARGNVRHTIDPAAPAENGGAPLRGGLLAGGETATLVVAREFAYTRAARSSRYEGDALLRAGGDELRAAKLVVTEKADGQRVLSAEGGVVSRLHPQPAGGVEPAPLEARAKVMVYDEALGKIAYRQEVVLRQDRLVTRSPRADLTLTPDGRGLRELVAGEPVELLERERRVEGARATYTPSDRKVVVEGEPVVLTGPGQEAHGRALTFHLDDDTILVDGRQESRTETVFRREPSQP